MGTITIGSIIIMFIFECLNGYSSAWVSTALVVEWVRCWLLVSNQVMHASLVTIGGQQIKADSTHADRLGSWMPPVEWVEEKALQLIPNRFEFLLQISFQCLLSFTCVPLSLPSSYISLWQSCFICSGLTYQIHSWGAHSLYVKHVVCYHVIASPYVRSLGCVFGHLDTFEMIWNAPGLWVVFAT